MKSPMDSGAGNRSGGRNTTRSLPYMSERQTQAYLLARDAIRRVQRTASILNAMSEDPVQRLRAANRRQNCH